MYTKAPSFWPVVKYVIGYSAALFAILQVLLSKRIRISDKVVWVVGLLIFAPLTLLLYAIVYKRIHGFYLHPSNI
jgi:hypothetical protein